jgi:hypothetical protein
MMIRCPSAAWCHFIKLFFFVTGTLGNTTILIRLYFKDFTYKDFTYKDFTNKDFTYKDFTYNITKCNITYMFFIYCQ